MKSDADPMPIAVPKCFYSCYKSGLMDPAVASEDSSPEPPESILVLQDMRPLGYETANLSKGLTIEEAESAIEAIAAIHALTLGMKIKEKIDLNEKYPVNWAAFYLTLERLFKSFFKKNFWLQFLFQISKATDSYQQLVEQGFPQLIKFLKGADGYIHELAALERIRPKTKVIIEKLLQPIEPMGLITHTDFWCNNLLMRSGGDDKASRSGEKPQIGCVILDWQMITYSRWAMNLRHTKFNLQRFFFILFFCVSFFSSLAIDQQMIWHCSYCHHCHRKYVESVRKNCWHCTTRWWSKISRR